MNKVELLTHHKYNQFMNRNTRRRLILTPLLFFSGFLLILFLQFSNSSQFSLEHMGLILSGTSAGQQAGNQQVQELSLNRGGLIFRFSRELPLTLITKDGMTHRARPEAFQLNETGLDILFSDQITLRVRVHEDSHFSLQPVVPENPENIQSLNLSFSLAQGSTAHPRDQLPLMAIENPREDLYMVLNTASTIALSDRRLSLVPEAKGFTPVIVEQIPEDAASLETFLAQNDGNNDRLVNYDSVVDNFLSRAFREWRDNRFDIARGTWSDQRGPNFYTDIAVATITESLVNNQYQTVAPLIQEAAALWPNERQWEGTTYFNDIVNQKAIQDTLWQEQLNQARSQMAEESLLFLYQEGGWEALALYGTQEDYRRLEDNLSQLHTTGETVEVLHLARNFLYLAQWEPALQEHLDRIVILLEEQLLRSLYTKEDTLFLRNNFGELDLYASILGGWVFQELGEMLEIPEYTTLGKNLVLSALKYERGSGYLPLYLVIQGEEWEGKDLLEPEDIYPLLRSTNYLPHYVNLEPYLGYKSWMWTSANITPRREGGQLQLDIQYPLRQTHHFIIQGIRPFSGLVMHKIPWNGYFLFQNFSDGWFYNPQTNTLFFKYGQRRSQGEILISLGASSGQ